MISKPTAVKQGQARVFSGVARAEWEAGNVLESQAWAVLAFCGAAVIVNGIVRLWSLFWGFHG
jgi:hypothetical protein